MSKLSKEIQRIIASYSAQEASEIISKKISENKNGKWIKVNSKKDLPEEDHQCWVQVVEIKTKIKTICCTTVNNHGFFGWWSSCTHKITHYMIIPKPEPPTV